MKSCLELRATMVSNEFIDHYMAAANGEYIKVYLYLLRHQGQVRDTGEIADALNHTEADVKRALGYWVRQGVLAEDDGAGTGTGSRLEQGGQTGGREPVSMSVSEWNPQTSRGIAETDPRMSGGGTEANSWSGRRSAEADSRISGGMAEVNSGSSSGTAESMSTAGRPAKEEPAGRKLYTPEQVSRLAGQEDFTQLLYIAQKYMNKVFTPRECEVFAYLYDALHMSGELLEYLVEYCVQNGHYSIRYMESVALNWHEKGILNVTAARDYTAGFSKEGFAVMRAFGISDRRPGESEQELIRKWFQEFGFTKDLVLEACSRTLKAIHKPSFSYADKILTDWKNGGVRVMADVQRMDRQRENRRGGKAGGAVKPSKNQFHNFEQRNTDYDAMVLERLRERLGEE